jgi:uncharacterized OB-fold protein
VEWFDASGLGTLHTYVIAHRGAPGFDPPYVIAVVELEEGPRMMSNIVDVEPVPEQLPAGMPLEVTWHDVDGEGADGDARSLPMFRPRSASS